MLLDGGSARNDTHTPASELTDRSDLRACSRNKSNFCLKEKNRAHYSQQTAMSFKDKTKQLLSATHSRQSFFSGKTVPSAQWLFLLLANLLGRGEGESKRWDHCWRVLETAKPRPQPLFLGIMEVLKVYNHGSQNQTTLLHTHWSQAFWKKQRIAHIRTHVQFCLV
jgi:hypothetical protein